MSSKICSITANDLNEKDLMIVNQFLDIANRTGSQAKAVLQSEIFGCLRYIGKDTILDIDEFDIEQYFNYLENKNLDSFYNPIEYFQLLD